MCVCGSPILLMTPAVAVAIFHKKKQFLLTNNEITTALTFTTELIYIHANMRAQKTDKYKLIVIYYFAFDWLIKTIKTTQEKTTLIIIRVLKIFVRTPRGVRDF